MGEVTVPEWMPDGLYDEWLNAYEEAGGVGVAGAAARATEVVRAGASYETYFPGIKRADGAIRYQNNPEQTYFNNIAAYKRSIEGVGVNPSVFDEEYIDLITGDTSPNEFEQRVNSFRTRVIDGGEETRLWYAQNAGVNFTVPAMIASLMSSKVESSIFNRDITMAEIGGQAAMRDYDISQQFSLALQSQGMDKQIADRFFGTAEGLLPVLNALAVRYGDPDDDFSLEEYADASFFNDAAQNRRLERLKAQENSTFTGGKLTDYVNSDRTGGITGLDAL